jgi:hypothetical protein
VQAKASPTYSLSNATPASSKENINTGTLPSEFSARRPTAALLLLHKHRCPHKDQLCVQLLSIWSLSRNALQTHTCSEQGATSAFSTCMTVAAAQALLFHVSA